MKFKIIRVEMKDDDEVVLYLRKVFQKVTAIPQPDVRNPISIIEFGLKLGEEATKRVEGYLGFDAVVTMGYEEYASKDFKVGDIVELEIKLAD